MKNTLTTIISIILCSIYTFASKAAIITYENNNSGKRVTYIDIYIYYTIPENYWSASDWADSGYSATEGCYDVTQLTVLETTATATPITSDDWFQDGNGLYWCISTGKPIYFLSAPDFPMAYEIARCPLLNANIKYASYYLRIKTDLLPGDQQSIVVPDEIGELKFSDDPFTVTLDPNAPPYIIDTAQEDL